MLAKWGFSLDPRTGEVEQLARYVGAFSMRAAQIARNIDRYGHKSATMTFDLYGHLMGDRLDVVADAMDAARAAALADRVADPLPTVNIIELGSARQAVGGQ